MKRRRSGSVDPNSRQAREDAAAWLANLRGPDRDEAGFKRWLDSDPSHAVHFDRATRLWEELGGAAELGRERRRSVSRVFVAMAAVVVLAVMAAAVAGLWVLRSDGTEQVFATAIGEQRTATLSDGSELILNTGTQLRVRYSRRGREVILDRGEAVFDVAPNPARPFVVISGEHEVRALGTNFLVYRSERDVAVTLLEGKVAVGRAHGGTPATLALLPGDYWTRSSAKVVRLDEEQLAARLAWRRDELVFDDTPLLDAVSEMNRYSTTPLAVDVGAAEGLRVTGIFRPGESESFARTVAAIYRLELRREGQALRLSPPTS